MQVLTAPPKRAAAAPVRVRQSSSRSRLGIGLDWAERIIILLLYGCLTVRVAAGCTGPGAAVSCILLVSEGLVVFLVLIRRGTDRISRSPLDWAMAFAATAAPLAVRPSPGSPMLPVALAAALMLMGVAIQVHAKLVLGRSFGCVAANRGLKFAGPYQFVRHPMYLGYLLTHVAFVLMNPTMWNLCSYAICYAIQIPRLISEERLLGADQRYLDYARSVRYRLIPGLF